MAVSTIGMVRRTDNLDIFKVLEGNRTVDPKRKTILMKSIQKHGYIPNPIIVNERYEVIDGQARLAACRELATPIDYFVVNGIGLDECRILNENAKNWGLKDFAESYAREGNINYIRLLELRDMGWNDRAVARVSNVFGSEYYKDGLKSGRFVLPEDAYWATRTFLSFMQPIRPAIAKTGNTRETFLIVCALAYCCENVKKDRLLDVIQKYSALYGEMFGKMRDSARALEQLYNKAIRIGKIDLLGAYDKYEAYMSKPLAWRQGKSNKQF